MCSFDWQSLAAQLLEQEERPLVLLDDEGHTLRCNASFERLLPECRATTGEGRLRDACADDASRAAFDEAFQRALRREPAQMTLALVNALSPFDLRFDLRALSSGTRAFVLAVLVDARPRPGAAPLLPALGRTYELRLGPGLAPSVVRATLPAGAPPFDASLPCWKAIFARTSECPDCPVRRLGPEGRASAVVPVPAEGFSAELVVAQRRSPRAVVVTTLPVDFGLFRRVVNERVAHLAARAGLTERESHLLALLVDGRATEEVARLWNVSTRTARNQQASLLKKLGASSRPDLLRLLG